MSLDRLPDLALVGLRDEFALAYISPETRRAYRADFDRFMRRIDGRFPTQADVISWRDEMIAARLSASTIARRLSVIRRFFGWLKETGRATLNPAEFVRTLPISQDGRTPGLTRDEAESLLAIPNQGTLKGKRDFALVNLMVRTGLRRAEAARLRVDDIGNLNGLPVISVLGKGGKARRIRLTREALEPLEIWIAAADLQPSDPLFPAWDGKARFHGPFRPISPGAIWNLVRRLAKAANLQGQGISPHSLRVTFTTLAIQGGAPIERTQAALGHAAVNTTMRYYRQRDETENAATTYIKLGGNHGKEN